MRLADARVSASIVIRSSIRLSFAGFDVDWMTKTSSPRTFSLISTKTSPSLKVLMSASARGFDSLFAMFSLRRRFEFPEISFMRQAPEIPARL